VANLRRPADTRAIPACAARVARREQAGRDETIEPGRGDVAMHARRFRKVARSDRLRLAPDVRERFEQRRVGDRRQR
jgi:hypothetical protein